MPPDRADALLLFQQGSCLNAYGGLTRRAASRGLSRSYNQTKRLLQELESLGLIDSVQEGESQERVYYPAERFKTLITSPLIPLDHLLDLEAGATNLPHGDGKKCTSPDELFQPPQGEVSGNESLAT